MVCPLAATGSLRDIFDMKERDPSQDSAQIADREHRAEIVERLYDVALDPIRLEELLEVWEGRRGPMRVGPVEAAIPLEDPEIEAHLRPRLGVSGPLRGHARRWRLSVDAGGYSALGRLLSDGGASDRRLQPGGRGGLWPERWRGHVAICRSNPKIPRPAARCDPQVAAGRRKRW